jgi:hypothetical protein
MNTLEHISMKIIILGYVVVLLAVAASGCACTCRHASAPSLSVIPPRPATGVTARDVRPSYSPTRSTTSYYDRVREERHRREVEKQLRDIKRNTQRP